jgi:homoserine dehydrogenase
MIRVGVVGFGTVGQGAARALLEHKEEIAARAGFEIGLSVVCSRRIHESNVAWLPQAVVRTANWRQVVESPDVDIVVELIGGTSVAYDVIHAALTAGKPVVTANKNLLAETGTELELLARAQGVSLDFEAAVAGGIPVLAAVREGLAGDRILALHGILNGTCNFILTTMEKTGGDMADVLREAQALGYAEADPSADLDGIDARYKLAILSRMAFGVPIRFDTISCRGITAIRACDFRYARQLGCTIRLIAAARRQPDNSVDLSVRPVLIPCDHILAKVDGAYNAVSVEGRCGGDTLYYGRGAGGAPTGISVVADLIRVARDMRSGARSRVPPLGFHVPAPPQPANGSSRLLRRYIRFVVSDRPGLLAELASVLARNSVNIDAVMQERGYPRHSMPFVITLEPTSEKAVQKALREMQGFGFLRDQPLELPIEEFGTAAAKAVTRNA